MSVENRLDHSPYRIALSRCTNIHSSHFGQFKVPANTSIAMGHSVIVSDDGFDGRPHSPQMTTCPHYKQLPLSLGTNGSSALALLRSKLESIGRSPRCDTCCVNSTGSVHICLNTDCLALGCGRNAGQHALKHFQGKQQRTRGSRSSGHLHAVAMNVASFQVWCYLCDCFLQPQEIQRLETEVESVYSESITDSTSSFSKQPRYRRMSTSSLTSASAGIVGLANIGNSCYMNAALQALMACPSISGFFRRCGAFVHRQPHHRLSESMLD